MDRQFPHIADSDRRALQRRAAGRQRRVQSSELINPWSLHMFTSKFASRPLIALGVATASLVIGTASPFAAAATTTVDQTATATQQRKMAACKSEMSSLRDICASEAGWGQPVMSESLSPEQQQAVAVEVSRYRTAVAACNGLLGNNRPICVSRAATPSVLQGMN
jgi:hypothetical protein